MAADESAGDPLVVYDPVALSVPLYHVLVYHSSLSILKSTWTHTELRLTCAEAVVGWREGTKLLLAKRRPRSHCQEP